jgi:hypothetical protein
VRCARCKQVWFATITEAPVDARQAEIDGFVAIPAMASAASASAQEPEPEPVIVPESEPEPEPEPAPEEASDRHEPSENAWAPPATSLENTASSPETTPLPPLVEQVAEDIETVAARRATRHAAQQRRTQQARYATAAIVLIAINLGLIGWRTEVVRWLPQTASFYAAIGLPVNVRGLVFANVTTVKEAKDGVQMLTIEGTIINDAKRAVEVPRLRFSIHNEKGHEIYSWTVLPDKTVLLRGESLPFRSRLASPPRESHQVLVRFFNRRDLVAGVQ